MSDLEILRRIETREGRSFAQVEAEAFLGTGDERFKNQWAYAV